MCEAQQLEMAHRSGDSRRVRSLLAEHHNYLLRVTRARMNAALCRRVDASDIVQEAQLEAIRRLDQFLAAPELPVRLWLRRIVLDRMMMAERRHLGAKKRSVGREQHPEASSQALAQRLLADMESPSQIASRREIIERVYHALDQIQHADREIITLHLLEGLTSQESAQVLGIEPAAARKRFGRALERLRGLLAAYQAGDVEHDA